MDTVIISAFVSAVVALVSLYFQRRTDRQRLNNERERIEVELAEKYQSIAYKAERKRSELEERLTIRIASLQAEITALRDEIHEKNDAIADLRDWAERLEHQVRECCDEEPVPYNPTRRPQRNYPI